jgi:hypothetical protein
LSDAPTPTNGQPITSYARDIRPLFTALDIRRMAWAFDLSKYADVKANAAQISDRIQGINGAVMPPAPPKGDGPWSQAWIDLFKRWVSEGCQP